MEAAEVLKEQVLKVLDEMPPQRIAEVLDFALFIKEHRGAREAYPEHDETGDAALLPDALDTLREYGDKPEAWVKWNQFNTVQG